MPIESETRCQTGSWWLATTAAVFLAVGLVMGAPPAAASLPDGGPAGAVQAAGTSGTEVEETEPAEPSEPEETEPEDAGSEDDAFDGARWWQWLLGGVLVIGAAAVIRQSTSRGPDPTEVGRSSQALLAHYQEVTARLIDSPVSREKYAYERGVLNTLEPRLDELIASTTSEPTHGLLLGLRSKLDLLASALRKDTEPETRMETELRITEAASEVEQAIRQVRSEL